VITNKPDLAESSVPWCQWHGQTNTDDLFPRKLRCTRPDNSAAATGMFATDAGLVWRPFDKLKQKVCPWPVGDVVRRVLRAIPPSFCAVFMVPHAHIRQRLAGLVWGHQSRRFLHRQDSGALPIQCTYRHEWRHHTFILQRAKCTTAGKSIATFKLSGHAPTKCARRRALDAPSRGGLATTKGARALGLPHSTC